MIGPLELIIGEPDSSTLSENFNQMLTQEEVITEETVECDPEFEECDDAEISIYDDVSQATLDAEASLYTWNMWMAVAHFSQATMILVLSQTVSNIKDFKLPLVTHYLEWNKGYPEQATQ